MPKAFDRNSPVADFDPNKAIEFNPLSALRQSTEMWETILGAIKEFAENLVKELIQKLLGIGIDPEQAIDDLWDLLNGWVVGILGPNSPLNAANLFGTIIPALLSKINIGSLTNEPQNLLPQPKFVTGSINDNPRWSVFSGSSRSADGSGCARLVANGTAQALRSGRTPDDKILVGANQTFTAEIHVRHSGYTGSGETVLLQVVPFNSAGVALAPFTMDAYAPTVANLDWPGHKLAGEYPVPDGVEGVQVRVLVTSPALTGTLDFDDGFGGQGDQSGLFQMGWIEGLGEALLDLRSVNQLVIDTVVNAIKGTSNALHSLEELFEAILHIPAGNVGGVAGPGTIAETALEILAGLVGGLSGSGSPSSGGGIADLFNISKVLAAAAAMGENAFQILSQRNNTDLDKGLLPSGRSNYGITSVNTTLSATQSASLAARLRVKEDLTVGVISWLGCGTSGMTAFYMNVRKLDANGDWDLVHHSPNILAELVPGTTPGWTFYQLDTPIEQKAGETYEYEWVPVGGTHSVRGISTADDIPDHPFAQVVGMAATRDNSSSPDSPPASIAKADVVTSGNIPWVEIAIDTGSGIGHYDDIFGYVTESGDITIPSWVNFIDLTAVGGGGGGMQGTIGFHGEPGSPGLYKSVTWQRGIHFGDNAVLTFTKGIGGIGAYGAGADGTASTWSIPGYSITAEPGVGGTQQQLGANPIGRGPGAYEYKGQPIIGGGDQKTTGADGVAPGGAGNGGNGLLFQPGGDGADGRGYYGFRQNPLEGESPVGGPGQIAVVGIDSAEAVGTPTISGGLSELPLGTRAAIDAIVAANLTAPGAVLSISGPAGSYRKAYGKAATGAGARDISLDDHFRIGSATKPFTATIVLRAIDQGLLSYDDVLETFIPGIPAGDKITIRHMLTMRSGVFNDQSDLYLALRFFTGPTSAWSTAETIDIIKRNPSQFTPGTKFAYTNSNYVLLGEIASKVYNRPISDLIQTDILDVLGMTQTSWPVDASMPAPYANGYAYTTGLLGGWAWQEASNTHPGYCGAAGALVSTVDDMMIWCREMRDGNLLSAESHAARSTFFYPEPWNNDEQLETYGYGYGMFSLAKWIGHAGSWRGYECSVYYLPDGTLFSLFENAQTPTVESETSLMYKIGLVLDSTSMDEPDYPNQIPGIPSKSAVGKPILGEIDVTFDNKSAVGTSMSAIPEFTIASDANIAFAFVSANGGSDLSGMSAKLAGVNMNRLPDVVRGFDRIITFWLLNPPTGPQSIKLLNPAYGIYYATGAASYKLASAVGIGAPVTAQGYSTTGSVSATSHAKGMTVNAFFYAGQKSTYSQTERGHIDAVAFANQGLIFGDATGGAATYTLNLTGSAPWIGVAIPIISNAE